MLLSGVHGKALGRKCIPSRGMGLDEMGMLSIYFSTYLAFVCYMYEQCRIDNYAYCWQVNSVFVFCVSLLRVVISI